MSYNQEKRNVPSIIICITVALVTLGLIAAIVISAVRNQPSDDPINRIPMDETTEPGKTNSDVTEPDTPNTGIPVITPGTEKGGEETEPPTETTEPGHVSVDILEQNKENEKENNPHIVGEPSILPGVKEVDNETNN